MSTLTAAFLETGRKGYGAATPPEAGPKKAFLQSAARAAARRE
jgi:hypothetical protein